ncbi:MAG TPA: gamma-glutamylcyclotransferase [Conexibacter sp.]|nr:gamma-glutamylcyclotransferase [Conexibacter sp.]
MSAAGAGPRFEAAMYGTVMRGQPHHHRIDGAELLRESRTAPRYRLLAVGGEYPLLVEATGAATGGSIAVQVFSLDAPTWRGKVDREPEGLLEGEAELEDGSTVAIMLGDPAWLAGRDDVEDITSYGGWAAFAAART